MEIVPFSAEKVGGGTEKKVIEKKEQLPWRNGQCDYRESYWLHSVEEREWGDREMK